MSGHVGAAEGALLLNRRHDKTIINAIRTSLSLVLPLDLRRFLRPFTPAFAALRRPLAALLMPLFFTERPSPPLALTPTFALTSFGMARSLPS